MVLSILVDDASVEFIEKYTNFSRKEIEALVANEEEMAAAEKWLRLTPEEGELRKLYHAYKKREKDGIEESRKE